VIRLLVKLGKWLESRFPAKVIVLESDYQDLKSRLIALEQQLEAHASVAQLAEQNVTAVVDRIGKIEAAAVHKGAVGDLVKVVSELKADLASFKTSIGFRTQVGNSELQAMLNEESINNEF